MTEKAGVIIRRRIQDEDFYLIEFPFENDHNKIDLPKGHIEPGETPSQAASRELKEETGIEIGPDALKMIRDTTVGDTHFYWFEPIDKYTGEWINSETLKSGRNSPEKIYGFEWRYSLKGLEPDVLKSLRKSRETPVVAEIPTLKESEDKEAVPPPDIIINTDQSVVDIIDTMEN